MNLHIPYETPPSPIRRTKLSASAKNVRRIRGFTLVELLTGSLVFVLLVVLLFTAVNQTSAVWRRAEDTVGAFQSVRFAFDLLTKTLSEANLNVYWTCQYDGNQRPVRYKRESELAFVVEPWDNATKNAVFFQAPLGATGADSSLDGAGGLLNAVGYYILYSQDPHRPSFLPQENNEYRFRLMQFLLPAEDLDIYSTNNDPDSWHSADKLNQHSTVIADNVIALVVWPRLPELEDRIGNKLTQNYTYDSRNGANDDPQPDTAHQLPPLVHITLIAIDETSARRFVHQSTPPEAITGILRKYFLNSNYEDYQDDVEKVVEELAENNIVARVFAATVPLRESKWSSKN